MEKEKKEIWKMIELLNEYEIWKWKNGLDIRQQYSEHNFKYNKWLYNIVISKKYWFIKWLVENDKINIGKAKDWEIMLSRNDEENIIWKLSISDAPIEDLISYLK